MGHLLFGLIKAKKAQKAGVVVKKVLQNYCGPIFKDVSRKVWLEVLEMRHNTSLILSECFFQSVFFAGKIGAKRSHLEIFV